MKLMPYLIGQITENPITYQWRADLRDYVKFKLSKEIQEMIHLIDPCNNPFSMSMLQEVNGNKKLDFAKNVCGNKQSKLFPAIDKAYVKKDSNSCIFNANHYTPETPFIGTIFELAWYHDQPWKPVVGVFRGDYTQDRFCMHPFVQDTVHTWVEDPREALHLLISLQHR